MPASSKLSAVGRPVGRDLRCQARAIKGSLRGRLRTGRASKKDPAAQGKTPPGPCQPPPAGGSASYRLAVGALKTLIEHSWAHLALIFALEQRTTAVFVAPAAARLVRRAVEDHSSILDP